MQLIMFILLKKVYVLLTLLSFKKIICLKIDVTVATFVVVVDEVVDDVDDVHVIVAFIAVLFIVDWSSIFKICVVGSVVGILLL